jgi:hypothetical protein
VKKLIGCGFHFTRLGENWFYGFDQIVERLLIPAGNWPFPYVEYATQVFIAGEEYDNAIWDDMAQTSNCPAKVKYLVSDKRIRQTPYGETRDRTIFSESRPS